MSRIISPRTWSNKPSLPMLRFDCFIDTAGYFFPMRALPQNDWRRLCDIYGDRPHAYSSKSKPYMLVAFQCPQIELLRELGDLCDAYCGNPSRLDIAFDVRASRTMTAFEQFVFIKEHMLLMRREAQKVLEIPNVNGSIGTFYVPHAHSLGAPRDIVLYWDRASKLYMLDEVAHFDLRLRRAAIKHLDANYLEYLDPSEIVSEHIRFVEFDRRRFERKLFSKVMNNADNEYQAAAQIADMKRYGQLDYVQRVHDQHRVRLPTNNGLVRLPNALTWGAQRRSIDEKTFDNEFNALPMHKRRLTAHEHVERDGDQNLDPSQTGLIRPVRAHRERLA